MDGYTQERGPDPEHRYNSHVIVNDAGEIAAVYRKIHLFDLDLPDGPEPVKLMESDATAPGTEVVACASVAGCLGVTVCYDLRFPELYQVGWSIGDSALPVLLSAAASLSLPRLALVMTVAVCVGVCAEAAIRSGGGGAADAVGVHAPHGTGALGGAAESARHRDSGPSCACAWLIPQTLSLSLSAWRTGMMRT